MTGRRKCTSKTARRFLALNPTTMQRLDGLFGHDRKGRRKREIATWLIFNRALDEATGKGVDLDAEPYCLYNRKGVTKLFKLVPLEDNHSDHDSEAVQTPLAGG